MRENIHINKSNKMKMHRYIKVKFLKSRRYPCNVF